MMAQLFVLFFLIRKFFNFLKRFLIISKGLDYDLGDSSKWEYMLPSNDKPILMIPKLSGEVNEEEVK
jgi:hypothetical protein